MSVFLIPAILVTCLGLLLAVLAAVSRHKKSAAGKLSLIGSSALITSELNPEGAVLVGGELWRARSTDGTRIAAQTSVHVVDLQGHLLLVKRSDSEVDDQIRLVTSPLLALPMISNR